MNGVDIELETILFALATIGALALFTATFLIVCVLRDGKRRDDAYESDTHHWMRKP